MSEVQQPKRSFYQIADDLATWCETIDMIDAQLEQLALKGDPLLETPGLQRDRRSLASEVDKLAGELAGKADAVVAVLQRFKTETQLIAAEEMRLSMRHARLEKTRLFLEDYVMRALDNLGTPFIKTPTASIRIQGNGGLAPLTTDAAVLPLEYWDVTLKMPRSLAAKIFSGDGVSITEQSSIRQVTAEPANSRIRTALAARCETCAGSGQHQGPGDEIGRDCPDCGGKGTAKVQGAKLEPRGRHLRLS